jgi:hypothetical protein
MKSIGFLIVFFSVTTFFVDAKSCEDILSNPRYFSAKASAETEEMALNIARDFLLNQISTNVQSASELRTKEISGEVSTDFQMVSSTSSTIRLKGLRHVVCQGSRRSTDVTVVVYISQDDLERSAAEVQKQVQEYFNVMEYKSSLGIEFLPDVYTAYLNTFLSPIAISVDYNGREIRDAKSFLGIILREHLNSISLKVGSPIPGSAGLEEQYSLDMTVTDQPQSGFAYRFESPSLNAQSTLIGGRGIFQYIKRPADLRENIRGYLSFAPMNVSSELQDLLQAHPFSKEIVFEVDYSKLVSVDFTIEQKANNMVFTPVLKNISARAFEWQSGNRRLSNNQIFVISQEDVPDEITLVVNGLNELAVRKSVRNPNARPKPVAQTQTSDRNNTNQGRSESQNISFDNISREFAQISSFNALQLKLRDLRNAGRATWGKKDDFINPDLCWVFLINADSKNVDHIFAPSQAGRKNLKTNDVHQNFENEFKGYIAIWVDVLL